MPLFSLCQIRTLAVLLPIAMLASACGRTDRAAPSARTIPVAMTHATPSAENEASYEGAVQPRHILSLAFRQGGRIDHIHVAVGDHVRKGQLIATISRADAQSGFEQAAGELASAKASLSQAVQAAGRSQGLDKTGALSSGEVQDRTLAVEAERGKVRAAKGVARSARSRLAETTLIAPDDGIVLAVPATSGTVVETGTEIARLATGATEVNVSIPQNVSMHVGQRVTVRTSNGEMLRSASVRAIDPAADSITRQHIVHVTVPTSSAVTFNDLATVIINRSAAPTTVRVPLTALVMEGAGDGKDAFVWLIGGDSRSIHHLDVRILGQSGADALVSGPEPGAAIVANGPEALHIGAAIRIVQIQDRR